MYRLAIAVILAALAILLAALLIRRVVGFVEAETNAPVLRNGGVMPRTAFFLLLCVMVYAIATGAT